MDQNLITSLRALYELRSSQYGPVALKSKQGESKYEDKWDDGVEECVKCSVLKSVLQLEREWESNWCLNKAVQGPFHPNFITLECITSLFQVVLERK